MTVAYRAKLIGGIDQKKSFGVTICVRVLLLSALAECAATHASAQQELGKVCGQVVSISCSALQPPTISIAVERILVSVDVESDGDHDARSRASQLLFRQVCALGQLTRKGTPFKPPVFTVASISRITARPDSPLTDWVRPGVARTCDAGVELPSVKKIVKPRYTAEALFAGVQGAVWVEAIVETDGKVGDARVIRSLDAIRGLDAEALNTAKRWRFGPGTKDGQPTPVLVTIEITFTIGDKRP
jgi:TonB family protein